MSISQNTIKDSLLSKQPQHIEQVDIHNKLLPQRVINGTNLFQTIFFGWIFSLLRYGSKSSVTVDAMPILPNHLQTQIQYNKLQTKFKQTIKSKIQGFTLTKALFKTYITQFTVILIIVAFFVGLGMFSPFLTSMIMTYINQEPSEKDISYGELLFGITLLSSLIKNLGETHMLYRFTLMGINMTNSLTLMIYQKSLRYASLSQKTYSESDIINYSQVDAERMTYMGYQLSAILVAPIQIVVGIVMMYNFIGISFVAGIGAMLLMIGLTFLTSKRSIRYNEEVLKVKDQRMKVTQQMLDIIRYIKINAIEKFFYGKIDSKRMKQIELYKKKGLMDVLNIFIYWLACPVILSATFFTYIQLGLEINSEVAFTTIMIFSILQYPIRLLPNCISEAIQMYASIKRIEKFLLAEEMKAQHIVEINQQDSNVAVRIERGDFYWGLESKKKDEKEGKGKTKDQKKNEEQGERRTSLKDLKDLSSEAQVDCSSENNDSQSSIRQSQIFTSEQIDNLQRSQSEPQVSPQQKAKYVHILKDINTTIQKSKFTIVIGDIGSGKTSLLLAILNEMRCSRKTSIQINGSIAYASQKPWILSGTVKQNIIFTQPFDEARFNRVIHHASLDHDIKILPKGIETEIGEKGVNLSGGQKARIGLARGLYSNRDIYLLDDVLSAVDVHVGEFLMKETLLGLLRGKTIIMPTHAVKFAEFVDEIIVMKKGRIARKGHYLDIRNTPEFQEISLREQKKEGAKEVEGEEKSLQKEYELLKEVMRKGSEGKVEGKAVEDRLVEELMLPQDHAIGKVDPKIFREYIKLNGGVFRFAFLVCLAMLLWITSTTLASIVMEKWCQDPIGQNYDLYLYMTLSICSNIFIFFRAYTLVISGAKQGESVHRSMMKSLLYASLANFYNRVPAGRIINRLTKDLRELDEAIGFAIGTTLVEIFSLLSALVICIYSSTPWILFPIAFVLFIANRIRLFYMKTQREVARLEKSTNSPIVSGYMSAISGLPTIRAYRKQSSFTEVQMQQIDRNKRVRLTKSALQSWFSLTLTYISFLVNMSAIGYCILSSNGNPSLAGLLMNYALNLSGNIIYTILSSAYFQTKIVSLERIYTFMKIPPEPSYAQYCLEWSPEEEGYSTLITKGRIQFKEVSVSYRKDLPKVLRGVNCVIAGGEKVGIVGRTGAGKTTIINTLLRVTEIVEGEVLVDGKSIQGMPLKDLRNGITMIDQEPTLIKSTFRENLDLTGRYSEEELVAILRECKLLETVVEKGGLGGQVSNESLSAGEKQLLCICRAFLKQSRVVLIDEATANIDLKNDEIIQRVIQDKFRDCTVLTIAHRLSTLKHCDKIMVMDAGRVIEFGSPEELQRNPHGFYSEMLAKNASEFLI